MSKTQTDRIGVGAVDLVDDSIPLHLTYRFCTEYLAYQNARDRYFSPLNACYSYYEARGIGFDFQSFLEFMRTVGPKPDPSYGVKQLSMERVAVEGFTAESGARRGQLSQADSSSGGAVPLGHPCPVKAPPAK